MAEKLGNPFKISELIETVNNLVDTSIDDSNLVHKTGTETINGTKTFTNSMTTDNILPKGDITLGTSTNTWGKQLQFRDTTGKRIARIQPMAVTTTNNRVGMWVNNADNSVEKGIFIDSDGTTQAPTPSAGDNSTKIATTAFVKAQGYAVDSGLVHTTGDENITGIKMFTSKITIGNTSSSLGSIELYGGNTSYGGNIDFHHGNSTDDYTSRLMERESGQLYIEKELAIRGDKYGQLRLIDGNNAYGMIFRNDGNNTYIIPTSAYDPYGPWNNNAVRFYIRNSDGQPVINGANPVGISAASYNSNGYVKFNHGLIIQWGAVASTPYKSIVVTFPISFTTDYKVILGQTYGGYTGEYVGNVYVKEKSIVGMTIIGQNTSTEWIAVGY